MNSLLLKMNLAGWLDAPDASGSTMWELVIDLLVAFVATHIYPILAAIAVVCIVWLIFDDYRDYR